MSAPHNTEDRSWWYKYGEEGESEFVRAICPNYSLDGKINPVKETDPTVPDLIVDGKLSDLKAQKTPFFTAGNYAMNVSGKSVYYDPSFTVTFNKKDYIRYSTKYPEIDIYFWVDWTDCFFTTLGGRRIDVKSTSGVWKIEFKKLKELIESNRYYLHAYKRRYNGDRNAKESYLIDLNDLQRVDKSDTI